METVILTSAPPNVKGRRLSYIVDGDPETITSELENLLDEGRFYTVADRDNGGESYVNPFQVVSVFAKPERV